ncbi:hypothetical protein GCM10022226_39710 [Sphaerisporangium flaviroseum]|uniref:Integrase SAM-like N-terminal domain-containing protein n=1 Tax=Sphaerisporangium flaviroseum TaxID=509199 RepID=A0ABP7IC90_9ACTN
MAHRRSGAGQPAPGSFRGAHAACGDGGLAVGGQGIGRRYADRTVTREQIMHHVRHAWAGTTATNTIAVHVKRLRAIPDFS